MRKLSLLLIGWGLPLGMMAQSMVPISMDEVLEQAASQNASIKIQEQEVLASEGDYRQTNSLFLPQLNVSHTGMATTNPLMAFGSKLNQEVLTPQDFDPNLLNDSDQVQNFATIVSVKQPLLNLDGLYQRRAANAKRMASEMMYQRTQEQIVLEVKNAYLQLQLSKKEIEVQEKTLQAAMANQKLALNLSKQGYLQQADLLAVEVRVGEVQNGLLMAKTHRANASNYLSFLLNSDLNQLLDPTDSLVAPPMTIDTTLIPLEERSDIKAMAYGAAARKSAFQSNKMEFLPTLNAFGSYELYDDHAFRTDASGYVVGAQLNWDLFKGFQRFGKSQKNKAEWKKSQLQYEQYVSQSQMQLKQAIRQVNDMQVAMALKQKAMEQTQESLRIRTNRFKEGLEKTTDLLQTETQYAQKQLEYYHAVYQYNQAMAQLQFLTQNTSK